MKINKKSRKKLFLILTGLPFRKQGNQSLIRFVNMFLNKNIKVILFSAGSDHLGENNLSHKLFSILKIFSIEIYITNTLNQLIIKISNNKKNKKTSNNFFNLIKSEDIIPPYGNYTFLNLLNKWSKLFFYLIDNILLILCLCFKHHQKISKATVIIGYEQSYTLCSKTIAFIFKKKYINKFQGTILKATNKNTLQAVKFFPHNFFGINKSDLCIMVNDGTDGKYYAKLRGCKNIFFEPHGVFFYKHQNNPNHFINKLKEKGKFILFNNASGSTWKRPDRIIRGLSKINTKTLQNIILVTTYHAENKTDLISFVKSKNLEKNIIFIDKIDNYESNYILQQSNITIMTNDFSNLGNPILESIYYKTPIISIDDGSLKGFLTNNIDSILIKLDKQFDQNLAKAIKKLYRNKPFYNKLKKNLNKNNQVKALSVQQNREFEAIKKLL